MYFKQCCNLFLFSIAIFLVASCSHFSKEEPTLFVGTYRVIDQNIPYPFLLEKDKDSIYFINYQNEIIDSAASKDSLYTAGDTLQMERHSFFFINGEPEVYLFDFKDSLSFPFAHYKYGARLKIATETSLPPMEEVKEKLTRRVYGGSVKVMAPNRDLDIHKHWKFSQDSLNTILSYYYQGQLLFQEQQIKKYHLFERQGKLFFSENEVPENPQMLYQITDFDGETFSILYYRYKERVEETYSRVEAISFSDQIPFFSKCLDGQPGEYYHDNITYLKGNDFLIKKVAANAPQGEGDGYITVHFTINCKGQVGNLGLEQMDRDFKSTFFQPDLVGHIVSEVVQLTAWPEIEASVFFKDIHAFLMFKIEDGKITDLCP